MPVLMKLHFGNFCVESRDMRELSAAQEIGYQVFVLNLLSHNNDSTPAIERIDGIEVHNPPCTGIEIRIPFRKNPHYCRILSKIKRIVVAMGLIRSAKADVISCHDIFMLEVAYLSYCFTPRKKRPHLVYDSHEFELYRNSKRSKLKSLLIRVSEAYLMRRCAFSIMVNDSIADEVQHIHRLPKRPIVVRSMPPCWAIDAEVVTTRRKSILKQLHVDSDQAFIVMYHGAIAAHRGIDTMLSAIAPMDNIAAVIMGYALDAFYFKALQDQVERLGIHNRVLFLPKVPYSRIWEYAGAVDAEMILLDDTFRSYYLSLPNKFFESIQSRTPLITSDFPEMKRLIDQYEIGLTCDVNSLDSIRACIQKLHEDRSYYERLKANISLAKKELCWENEKKVLQDAYLSLL